MRPLILRGYGPMVGAPQTAADIANAISDGLVQVVLAAGGRSTDILTFVDLELAVEVEQLRTARAEGLLEEVWRLTFAAMPTDD